MIHHPSHVEIFAAKSPHDRSCRLEIRASAVRLDGDHMISVGDRTVTWWDRRGEIVKARPLVMRNGTVVDQWVGAIAKAGERIAIAGALSPERFAARDPVLVGDVVLPLGIHDATGKQIWDGAWRHGLGRIDSLAFSDDGDRLAIGYRNEAGRGWAVLDVDRDRMIDRTFITARRSNRPAMLAIDRAGKRLVAAWPDGEEYAGAIRLGKSEIHRRDRKGAPTALAIDDKGVIAVFAFGRRLQVEYLDANVGGPELVALESTITIEADTANIVALAIAPDRRTIACVAPDGTFEIAMVP